MANISTPYNPEVLLLSLPWTNLDQPSLGLGILKSVLSAKNISSEIRHLNLEMLRFLSAESYVTFAQSFGLNDFIFSGYVEGKTSKEQIRVLSEACFDIQRSGRLANTKFESAEDMIDKTLFLRENLIPEWLEEVAIKIAQKKYSLIGMTCLFDQTIASLAMSKAIKKYDESSFIALGGYAVRQPTGSMILQCSPYIDAVCIDEGEGPILDLYKIVKGQKNKSESSGLVFRNEEDSKKNTQSVCKWEMDDIPPPSYEDYFKDIKLLEKNHKVIVEYRSLPLENSRGCWWGEKKHCIFCGIKSSDLIYRHKKAESVIADITHLIDTYDCKSFRFADYIMPNSYYKTLLPKLAEIVEENPELNFGGEIKANVTEEKIKLFAKCNFTDVQPGIESFSTEILKQMDKGVDAVTCIYVMRLGKEYGVKIFYNLLFGFPGEREEPYKKIADELQNLYHLDAPTTCVPVQITRNAPMQVDPLRFNIEHARPHRFYEMIFSKRFRMETGFRLQDYAYNFERPFENPPRNEKLYAKIKAGAEKWADLEQSHEIRLTGTKHGQTIKVFDNRFHSERNYDLDNQEIKVLSAFFSPSIIASTLSKIDGISSKESEQIFNKLCELDLVFCENDSAVSLLVFDKSHRIDFDNNSTASALRPSDKCEYLNVIELTRVP